MWAIEIVTNIGGMSVIAASESEWQRTGAVSTIGTNQHSVPVTGRNSGQGFSISRRAAVAAS
jgi:hypothetical protein